MKNNLIILLIFIPALLSAQSERKYIREGVKNYEKEEFSNAEVNFRKAEEENNESFIARFNTTTAMYARENYDESVEQMTGLLAETTSHEDQAKLHHNIGNALINKQQYAEAAEAYKNSLRLQPDDEETRYNLAYALEKLREQQQQQQQQNQQEQDQDQQQQDQDQQQQDQNQDQNEDQQEQDQNRDQQQEAQQENDTQQQQQQPKTGEISEEEAERLLNAILQQEKDVKEEVDKKKAKAAARTKTDKDW